MEQANRQPKQNRTAHTKRTAVRQRRLDKQAQKPAKKQQAARPAGREQSGGTPQKKGRSLLGLHVKKQQKNCALCTKQTSRTDSAKEFPAHTQRLQKKCRDNDHTSRHSSGRLPTNGRPGRRRGMPGTEKPLRTGKIRVRSFACPEGPCEPGPPKNRFAVFGWHGFLAAHCAQRGAQRCTKGGAAPAVSPAGSGAVCQWQTGSTDRIGR